MILALAEDLVKMLHQLPYLMTRDTRRHQGNAAVPPHSRKTRRKPGKPTRSREEPTPQVPALMQGGVLRATSTTRLLSQNGLSQNGLSQNGYGPIIYELCTNILFCLVSLTFCFYDFVHARGTILNDFFYFICFYTCFVCFVFFLRMCSSARMRTRIHIRIRLVSRRCV